MKILFLALLSSSLAYSQSPRTEDEANTIGIFKKAQRSVVHLVVSQHTTQKFGEQRSDEGTGGGFLIDREGHTVTNYHIIEGSNRIDAYLPKGRATRARIVGTGPSLDLALLHVELTPDDDVEPLVLGDSQALEVGQKVIAVGHPLALHNTVTVGIVSALKRSLQKTWVELGEELIQTDAAISPGSSGGPLLDSSGRVIGIATAFMPEGQNVGFAIPIDLFKHVLPDLIRMGHPYQPPLGVTGIEITPELAELLGLEQNRGLLIQQVAPGTLADRAGLRAGERMIALNETVYVLGGDIIVAVNDKEVSSSTQITWIVLESHLGDRLRFRIFRDGQFQEIGMTLGDMHRRW